MNVWGSGSESKWITWDSPLSRQWRRRVSVSQSASGVISTAASPPSIPFPPHTSFGEEDRLCCFLLHFVRARVPLYQARRGRYSVRKKHPARVHPLFPPSPLLHRTYLFMMTANARRRMWPLKLFFVYLLVFPPFPLLFIFVTKLHAFALTDEEVAVSGTDTTEMHGRWSLMCTLPDNNSPWKMEGGVVLHEFKMGNEGISLSSCE